MLPSKSLEINGKLSDNLPAELLAESYISGLSGSFRLSNDAQKIIVYLREGEVVFAVSNSRQHRLFHILLNLRQITQERLTQFENVANDLEFGQKLVEKGFFGQSDIDVLLAEQLKQVLQTALDWKTGEWIYSPFARIKENINFKIDLGKLLFDFSRKLNADDILPRFKTSDEEFLLNKSANLNANLLPHEGFILSRLDQRMKIEEIKSLCGLSDFQTLKSLYSLWLGGFIKRFNFLSAFPVELIERISSAKFKLSDVVVKPKITEIPNQTTQNEVEDITQKESQIPQEVEADTIETYILRTEKAFSYYDLLGVEKTAELSQIKQVYFNLAKQFHPDKFHNEAEKVKKQLQDAFSQLAQAYDTLKDKDQRELYDFKLKRKIANLEEAEEMKKREKAKGSTEEDQNAKIQKAQLAKGYFDRGFNLLMNNETELAIPFLANASNLDPSVARYHAYYGKSLIGNKKYRHQAEQELLTAIKIEQTNPDFRIMLVEFYIEYGLMKRADGELQKLLEIAPNNKEAKMLLDKMPKK
jgi:curved DNA-binding protein CbpA